MKRSQTTMRFRISCTPRAFGVTDFTVSPTNTSPRRLPQIAPDIAKGRVIVAHLGSGASMCALKQGRSVESTMGFTALDGLADGNAAGTDRSRRRALSHRRKGHVRIKGAEFPLSRLRIERAFRHQQRHARTGSEPGSAKRALAIDYFVYRIGLNAGMLAAALAGSRCVRLHRRHRRKLGAYPRADRRASSPGLA